MRTVFAADDTIPPALISASVSPSTVAAGGMVEVRARITDAGTGVRNVGLGVAPLGASGGALGQASLESGTAADGVWLARLTIPAQGISGTWGIVLVSADDPAGNSKVYGSSDPLLSGATFTVTGGSNDTAPPILVSASVSPSTVAAGGMVDVRARLTDAGTGVRNVGLGVAPLGASGGALGGASLESGTAADGIWLARLTIPAQGISGTWGIVLVSADDPAGNSKVYGSSDPLLRGATFTVTDPACSQRPRPQLSLSRVGGGRLQATVTAGFGNVTSIQFGPSGRPMTNAIIDIPGASVPVTSGFTHTPASGTSQVTFFVRRAQLGQAATVPLMVTDGCGPWNTFVGGGPSAF